MRLSPVLASLAHAFQIPLRTSRNIPTRPPHLQSLLRRKPSIMHPQHRPFSTSPPLLARSKGPGYRPDKRITLIRYFLQHPRTPRVLRFSRNRALRHWTIHRAHMMHREGLRFAKQLELQRQYDAMRAACEELRVGAGDGGRLFRTAMNKRGVWAGMPVEYGRIQTEWPRREGWDHDWVRR